MRLITGILSIIGLAVVTMCIMFAIGVTDMSRASIVVFIVCLIAIYYCIQRSKPIIVEHMAPWPSTCKQQDGLFVPENIHATMRTDINLDRFLEYGYMSDQLRAAMEYQKKYGGTNPPPSYTAGSQLIAPYSDVVIPIEPIVLPVVDTSTSGNSATQAVIEETVLEPAVQEESVGVPVETTSDVNSSGEETVISNAVINDNAPNNTLIVRAPEEDAVVVTDKAIIPSVAIIPSLPQGTPETVIVPEETSSSTLSSTTENFVVPGPVVLFYSPTCPHCTAFMNDVWPRVKHTLKHKMEFYEINGPQQPQLANEFNVAYYPSLFKVKPGRGVAEFKGARTFSNVLRFCQL